jgi:hypothetical protein
MNKKIETVFPSKYKKPESKPTPRPSAGPSIINLKKNYNLAKIDSILNKPQTLKPRPTRSPTPIPTRSPTPIPTRSPTPIPTRNPTRKLGEGISQFLTGGGKKKAKKKSKKAKRKSKRKSNKRRR